MRTTGALEKRWGRWNSAGSVTAALVALATMTVTAAAAQAQTIAVIDNVRLTRLQPDNVTQSSH